MNKSSRHSKIIGDYGESLVCNWLSRSGFEVTLVDHTGIDVVAYNPQTNVRLGISVKSRTRGEGKEKDSVNLLSNKEGREDRAKVVEACRAFAAEPWLAVYVESAKSADLYLLPPVHYESTYKGERSRTTDVWKMSDKTKQIYNADKLIKHIHIEFEITRWDWI